MLIRVYNYTFVHFYIKDQLLMQQNVFVKLTTHCKSYKNSHSSRLSLFNQYKLFLELKLILVYDCCSRHRYYD